MFITVFTRARHLSLTCATLIQSSHLRSCFFQNSFNIILCSTLRSSEWLFPLGYEPKPCFHFSSPPYVPHACAILFFFIFLLHTCHMPVPSSFFSFFFSIRATCLCHPLFFHFSSPPYVPHACAILFFFFHHPNHIWSAVEVKLLCHETFGPGVA